MAIKNTNIKKISVVILVIFYFVAGCNHFYNPASYYHIIPRYLPYPIALNILAGFFEILFALMAVFQKTRRFAAYGIILMLLAFLPVHIQMVIDAPLIVGTFTVSPWVAWIRLVILQPLLIIWAWWHRE